MNGLLLEIGMPFRREGGRLKVETQALNGLRLWAKHFGAVTVCANELPAGVSDASSVVWADPTPLVADGRLRLESLPCGYHPRDHFRWRAHVNERFARLLPAHRYLCFSTLGAFGAWGNVAAAQARRQKRPHSLWLDWVLHAMATSRSTTIAGRFKEELVGRMIRRETHKAIRGCDLGLFHGQTVYDAYAPLCRRPALVHNVHLHPEDALGDLELAAKVDEQRSRSCLRIGYVGRVHPMKAPLDWLDAVEGAIAALGAGRVEATWLGDGPMLAQARARVAARGLERSIAFKGFVSDRSELLSFLRRQDVLLSCHVTPESPRCLVESLVSATPLVGYESAFARELVGRRGGGLFGPIGDAAALTGHLVALANDRSRLAALTLAAAQSRAIYSDEAVFAHRSELIKRYLH